MSNSSIKPIKKLKAIMDHGGLYISKSGQTV